MPLVMEAAPDLRRPSAPDGVGPGAGDKANAGGPGGKGPAAGEAVGEIAASQD